MNFILKIQILDALESVTIDHNHTYKKNESRDVIHLCCHYKDDMKVMLKKRILRIILWLKRLKNTKAMLSIHDQKNYHKNANQKET
jgi:hypothetical protein